MAFSLFFLHLCFSFMVCMISTLAAFNNAKRATPSTEFVFSHKVCCCPMLHTRIKHIILASVVLLCPWSDYRFVQMRKVWNLEFRLLDFVRFPQKQEHTWIWMPYNYVLGCHSMFKLQTIFISSTFTGIKDLCSFWLCVAGRLWRQSAFIFIGHYSIHISH